MESINKSILRKRDMDVRSSRSDPYQVVSYTMFYDATDVMDNNNHATALSAQIQVSIVVIGTVRKPSVVPKILANRWHITPENVHKTIQATMKRGNRTMLHLLLSR